MDVCTSEASEIRSHVRTHNGQLEAAPCRHAAGLLVGHRVRILIRNIDDVFLQLRIQVQVKTKFEHMKEILLLVYMNSAGNLTNKVPNPAVIIQIGCI